MQQQKRQQQKRQQQKRQQQKRQQKIKEVAIKKKGRASLVLVLRGDPLDLSRARRSNRSSVTRATRTTAATNTLARTMGHNWEPTSRGDSGNTTENLLLI